MDKFATLEPVRLYASTGARLFSRGATSTSNKDSTDGTIAQVLVGRLPSNLHLIIVYHLPIPDIATYGICCRATRLCAANDSVWEKRWKALGIDNDPILQNIIEHLQRKKTNEKPAAPPEDDFGDFTTAELYSPSSPDVMRDFSGAFQNMQLNAPPTPSHPQHAMNESYKKKYTRVHNLLKPLIRILLSPPHLILSQLAEQVSPSLYHEAKILRLLSHFLSPGVQPLRRWESLYLSLRSAMDRFDSNLLAAFDIADERGDEEGMREAAASSWELLDKSSADWEMGKVWTEKKEIFYQQGSWKALDNFTKDQELDFAAMDEFMEFILKAIKEHGSMAVRVFPPASHVLLFFSERLSSEVVGEYVATLLAHAREISEEIFLKSTAASFREAWKMVDRIMEVANQRKDSNISKTLAEDVVYKMFETHMDEYLDEEIEWVKHAFDVICKGWDQETSSASSPTPAIGTTRFLASQNPALVKRNVLASFTSLLLLPVTIVPRTVGVVGEALITGGSAAVQGIAMLNPQRWGPGGAIKGRRDETAYSTNLEKDGRMLFEADEDDEDIVSKQKVVAQKKVPESLSQFDLGSPTPLMTPSNSMPTPLTTNDSNVQHQLDLLLSLDVALEIIHADRESLKRVETFAGYPGHYGHRVHDTIEEVFILMLQTVGERHISKGFALATERMKEYKPAEHSETSNVAPLVQFFELVHIGDTIQSMVQVYFDKELAPHIDKTDFLNVVVREKKRFENTLDDSVAAGLNGGTEVLMNQIDHIISKLTKPREYYPPEDDLLELGPTTGCIEAIRCLETHCKLLKGSTSKEVLEVFYQEVGLRLIAILQKHIKRQIISLNGGFLVISDLNAYNAFIVSLKVPSITADFAHLKMLGHVYVVEDAKDLAQIVRDVTRYGGAYKPEDVYEFIQRRSDWKKIEKIVDKTMYSLSFKEDCTIA